ncbi:MAG: ACP S-malonyltransferase, partial [Sphingobacteriaceae bacterium]
VKEASEKLKAAGAKRVLPLNVGGAFHSPLMELARVELEKAILNTTIEVPVCPIYQNVNAEPTTDPDTIKINLNKQLTGAVRWTQTMQRMLQDGATSFIETGPGNVLQGLVKKVDKNVLTAHA